MSETNVRLAPHTEDPNWGKLTDREIFIIKALEALDVAKKKQRENAEFMKTKEFDYGTPVIMKSIIGYDGNSVPIYEEEIGIIVGHYHCDGIVYHGDNAKYNDTYRVHFNEKSSYQGVRPNALKRYEGELPEHLKNVEWNEIYNITVKLKEYKEKECES